MAPMFLVYRPPQMLPTEILNPVDKKTTANSTDSSKSKRDLSVELPDSSSLFSQKNLLDSDYSFWFGIVMVVIGGTIFIYTF
jgi:hypothetical protein